MGAALHAVGGDSSGTALPGVCGGIRVDLTVQHYILTMNMDGPRERRVEMANLMDVTPGFVIDPWQ